LTRYRNGDKRGERKKKRKTSPAIPFYNKEGGIGSPERQKGIILKLILIWFIIPHRKISRIKSFGSESN
jgi:hypothetical protein